MTIGSKIPFNGGTRENRFVPSSIFLLTFYSPPVKFSLPNRQFQPHWHPLQMICLYSQFLLLSCRHLKVTLVLRLRPLLRLQRILRLQHLLQLQRFLQLQRVLRFQRPLRLRPLLLVRKGRLLDDANVDYWPYWYVYLVYPFAHTINVLDAIIRWAV